MTMRIISSSLSYSYQKVRRNGPLFPLPVALVSTSGTGALAWGHLRRVGIHQVVRTATGSNVSWGLSAGPTGGTLLEVERRACAELPGMVRRPRNAGAHPAPIGWRSFDGSTHLACGARLALRLWTRLSRLLALGGRGTLPALHQLLEKVKIAVGDFWIRWRWHWLRVLWLGNVVAVFFGFMSLSSQGLHFI